MGGSLTIGNYEYSDFFISSGTVTVSQAPSLQLPPGEALGIAISGLPTTGTYADYFFSYSVTVLAGGAPITDIGQRVYGTATGNGGSASIGETVYDINGNAIGFSSVNYPLDVSDPPAEAVQGDILHFPGVTYISVGKDIESVSERRWHGRGNNHHPIHFRAGWRRNGDAARSRVVRSWAVSQETVRLIQSDIFGVFSSGQGFISLPFLFVRPQSPATREPSQNTKRFSQPGQRPQTPPGSAGVSPASSGFRLPTGRRDASAPRNGTFFLLHFASGFEIFSTGFKRRKLNDEQRRHAGFRQRPFLRRFGADGRLECPALDCSLDLCCRDVGAGRGRRVLRPHGGRRFAGRNGLLAELEAGGHVISARHLAFIQPDLRPRELCGVPETVAFGPGCRFCVAHRAGHSDWQ